MKGDAEGDTTLLSNRATKTQWQLELVGKEVSKLPIYAMDTSRIIPTARFSLIVVPIYNEASQENRVVGVASQFFVVACFGQTCDAVTRALAYNEALRTDLSLSSPTLSMEASHCTSKVI